MSKDGRAKRDLTKAAELLGSGEYDKALPILEKWSDEGAAPATHMLAMCYVDGAGVEKDLAKAIALYVVAAEAGYPFSKINLAALEKAGEYEPMGADERKWVAWGAKCKSVPEIPEGGVDNSKICPCCYGDSIRIDKRGFGLGNSGLGVVLAGPIGLLGGLVGSKRYVGECFSCGHKWYPGDAG